MRPRQTVLQTTVFCMKRLNKTEALIFVNLCVLFFKTQHFRFLLNLDHAASDQHLDFYITYKNFYGRKQ